MWFYLVAMLLLLLFILCKRHMDTYKQWSHLPGVKPHWFWGNKPIFSKNIKDIYLDHYNALKDARFGLFWNMTEPCIFLKDLELIKKVQITDHENFMDFGFSPIFDDQINQFGLADLRGETWKRMKRQLTPTMSIPRLKKNVSDMNDVGRKLVGYLHSQENKEFVEVINFSKKFYLGCLASIGFGINVDCFSEKESEFEKHAKTVFNVRNFLFTEFFPKFSNFFKISIIDPTFSKYLSKLCKGIVAQRKNQNLQFKDMLSNMVEVSKINPDMTDEIMYKTCVQFFGDGYESASLVFGVTSYYLTAYPEVQARLQEEIDEVFNGKDEGEDIDADDITKMTYLDQVMNEGMRIGPLPMTGRTCTKDWQIPGDSFVVPKGTRVLVPIVGLHYDPKYWTDPLKFDPERFSSENKNFDSICFQTFGSGPRQCLGKNLYILESKVMIIHLLRNFSLKPHGHMPRILEWDMEAFIGKSKYEIKVERRNH